MKRKGDMILWEISDFKADPKDFATLGFDDFVPRNDYRSAAIKVLITLTKGNDKLYRRFNDKVGSVSFGLFKEVVSSNSINIDKELEFTVDKKTGEITSPHSEWAEFVERSGFNALYADAKKTLDGKQIRSIILRAVKAELRAIPIRTSGGVYFVDARFDEKREKLDKLFKTFPEYMKMHSIPVYDDNGTLEAIEDGASTDIFKDIEVLITDIEKEFKSGEMTRKKLEGDKAVAVKILDKIKLHEENLRSSHKAVKDRLDQVQNALEAVTERVEAGIVEPEDFMAMLKGLKD